MKSLKYLITIGAMLLLYGSVRAQKTVSVYQNESQISDPVSVTLTDGFYAPAGSNLRVFTGKSYQQCNPFVSLPSNNQNYISTRIFKKPNVTEQNLNDQRSTCEVNQTIQYFDGLGRALQAVQVQGSPGFKDIVQPFEYDVFGREVKKYQPYAEKDNANGSFRENAIVQQGLYYSDPLWDPHVNKNNYPFSITVLEASPLSRIQKQGFPGADWQPLATGDDHTLKTDHSVNIANEVKQWVLTPDGAESTKSYDPGKLYKTILQDENWRAVDGQVGTTEEFKDFEGHVVLKRMFNKRADQSLQQLSTYYIYDDFGNLRYVLPPAVNENSDRSTEIYHFNESQTVFLDFIYGYHHDARNRVVEKKIPGKGWEFMVYNKLDQVVMSQDANQRNKSPQEWNFTKYDAFGRVVISGRYTDNLHNGQSGTNFRVAFQDIANGTAAYEKRDGSNMEIGYSNDAIPQGSIGDYYVLNYYDNYDFPGNTFGQPGTGQAPKERAKSLLTGTKVKILGTGSMLLTVNYYDLEGRIIQSKSSNHLNGTDVVDNIWNFDGSLNASTRTHTVGSTVTTIANRYEYDHLGRKIATFENINNQGEIALSHLEYNEIGQLSKKNLHNDSQATTFAYNERGWMKNITSDQFSMELKYNDGSLPQFNGNISGQNYSNGTANTFSYTYDRLNRLTNAAAGNNLGEAISYDVMGNITSLRRDNFGINNYNGYNGNRLTSIGGFTNSNYGYDANGNLTSDSQKNITLGYNFLNLPQTVSGNQNLIYTYNAAGEKLQKQAAGNVTNYIEGIQYTNNSIDFIQTEEGLARRSGNNYSYEYNLSDHLGNVRVTFYQNPTTNQLEVLQRDDYYAFGLRKEPVAKAGLNKYLYNGKELQEELGQYDYGARFYDPVIGRWNVVDPLAEKDRKTSPYVYVFNNPVRFIDPDGMEGEDPQMKVNTVVTSEEDKKNKLHVTQTTTTTKIVKTETGSVTTKTIMSSTNIISNSDTEATKYGNVTTKTSVTTVDGDKVSTVNQGATTVSRQDSKSDLSALNTISKSLENFRNDHGMQFNSYVNKEGTSALSLSVGGAAAPFGGLASLSTLATNIGGWAPSLVRALGFGGMPTSVGPGLASKAINASGVLNGSKVIFVSSNGRVISNMLPKR
ncbi:DUF6443 domain-containing protein [Pedobacter terrae]|uniref:DUF6443 domain-containing protein n=1 Tax=Pedobacter terrae TaxID=405671 RepID=UPI002FF7B7D3